MTKSSYNISIIYTFMWLLWADVHLFFKDAQNHFINALCWPLVIMLSNGYVLPALGMPGNYGPFSSVSMLIIMASFTAWDAGRKLLTDIEGPRSILYELSLPLPSWLVFAKYILIAALEAGLFNLMSLVMGKCLFFHTFDISSIAPIKFIMIYILTLLFFSSFALCAALFAGNSGRFFQIELRLAGPLFFICGQAFAWKVLHSVSPLFATLMLATPWLYAYEGNRAAILGQEGFLSYWICLAVLLLFFISTTIYGFYLFKKRLDIP